MAVNTTTSWHVIALVLVLISCMLLACCSVIASVGVVVGDVDVYLVVVGVGCGVVLVVL